MQLIDEDALAEMEESALTRRAMEAIARVTAEVVIDIESKGPLQQFIAEQFDQAQEALIKLALIDPTDAPAIYALQLQIRPYLTAIQFVRSAVSQGEEFDEAIKEMHGNGPEED